MIRIVVSAPNGTATGGVSNAGVIYTCSLRQNQMCQPLNGDGGGADRRLYDTDGKYIVISQPCSID